MDAWFYSATWNYGLRYSLYYRSNWVVHIYFCSIYTTQKTEKDFVPCKDKPWLIQILCLALFIITYVLVTVFHDNDLWSFSMIMKSLENHASNNIMHFFEQMAAISKSMQRNLHKVAIPRVGSFCIKSMPSDTILPVVESRSTQPNNRCIPTE